MLGRSPRRFPQPLLLSQRVSTGHGNRRCSSQASPHRQGGGRSTIAWDQLFPSMTCLPCSWTACRNPLTHPSPSEAGPGSLSPSSEHFKFPKLIFCMSSFENTVPHSRGPFASPTRTGHKWPWRCHPHLPGVSSSQICLRILETHILGREAQGGFGCSSVCTGGSPGDAPQLSDIPRCVTTHSGLSPHLTESSVQAGPGWLLYHGWPVPGTMLSTGKGMNECSG